MSTSRIDPSAWWERLNSEQRKLACSLARQGEFPQSGTEALGLRGNNPELADYVVHVPNSDKVTFALDVAAFLQGVCAASDE
jgi:hypothetical protein